MGKESISNSQGMSYSYKLNNQYPSSEKKIYSACAPFIENIFVWAAAMVHLMVHFISFNK